jgi:hypothetical protein
MQAAPTIAKERVIVNPVGNLSSTPGEKRTPVCTGRKTIAALLLLLSAGCPSDRLAQRAMRGSPRDLPPAMPALAPPALAVITELRGPESVLYDPQQDVYYISNLNGGLLNADNNGFITRVNAETFAVDRQWIAGGRNGVTLDAPKGMALVGDALYVSDIAGVRKFNRRSGASEGVIALPGATLINDLATDGTNVYVSDTGLRTGPGTTFIDTRTDSIWKIHDDRAEKIAAGHELGHPNGLDFVDGKLRVVTFGGEEVYELDNGRRGNEIKLPAGELDGITRASNGDLLISSWAGHEIFRGPRGGPFTPILGGLNAPADIGYDTKRQRLLVPHSGSNLVTIHSVP